MSYCRWSTDDFQCDLYSYECVDETWTTHVAGSRYVGEVPPCRPLPKPGEDVGAWVARKRAQSDWLKTAVSAPIGLPHDGATFKDETLEEFLATLLMLREAGYRFPDHVLDSVREEIADEGLATTPPLGLEQDDDRGGET